ncbi:hypothetical protein FS837_002310 [Tulasnella sp. UAMH 9824]|nr:hypothetical protein FS837_002310 [Tulasnella sp. UAMH 9824]
MHPVEVNSAQIWLEKLAPWRIDPSLVKFSKLGPSFEGGCAVVSRALLHSSGCDVSDQLWESKPGGLTASNGASELAGVNECRETESSKDEVKTRTKGGAEGQEQEFDCETSGRRHKSVAVKKMKVKTRSDLVKVLGLAIREAEFLVDLCHENIIELEGFVEDVSKNTIWLVFPWEESGNLKEFIASAEWEIPERISLLDDVANGMKYLHTRNPPICHGDLKSANILVNSECRAVITDFGSAHRPATERHKRPRKRAKIDPEPAASPEATFCPATNTITLTHNKWTLRWAAPELLEEDDASLASDVWAFGCVAYEVMTDSIPFQDVKDLTVVERVVRGDLPSISSDARMMLIQALCTLVGQCWTIDPSKRPTAEECQRTIDWMASQADLKLMALPMIVPNQVRATNAASLADRSARLLMELGRMHRRQSDYVNASEYYTKALGLCTNIGDSRGEANALLELARIHQFQDNQSQAITSYTDALKIHTKIGDGQGKATALLGLAEVHRLQNDHDKAVTLYSECLQIQTDIGARQGRADALWGLADVHRVRNECSQAMALFTESLEISIDINDLSGKAFAFLGIADTHRNRAHYTEAISHYEQAVEAFQRIGYSDNMALALEGADDTRQLFQEQEAT